MKSCFISANLKSSFSKTKLFPISSSVVINLQKSAFGPLSPFPGFPDFGALGLIFNLLFSSTLKVNPKNVLGNSSNKEISSSPTISLSIKYLLTPWNCFISLYSNLSFKSEVETIAPVTLTELFPSFLAIIPTNSFANSGDVLIVYLFLVFLTFKTALSLNSPLENF